MAGAGRSMLGKLSRGSRSRNLLGPQLSSASALHIRTTAFSSDGGTTLGNHLRGLSAGPTTGMSSIITAIVDSVRAPKRTSSSEIIKHNIDWEAERAAMEARLEANKKILSSAILEARNAEIRADFERRKTWLENLTDTSNAELAAWRDKMDKDADEFDRLVNGILCVLAVITSYGIYLLHSSLECRRKEQIAARANVEDQNP